MTRPYAQNGHALRVPPDLAQYVIECGRRIRDARLDRDVPIDELAAATGINRVTLCRMEQGKNPRGGTRPRGPSLITLVRIALALGMSPAELMP